MGIFSSIVDKLLGRKSGDQQAGQQPGASGSQSASAGPASAPQQAGAPAATQAQVLKDVDVEAVLAQMATQKGGGGNYKTSIVDLLKLLDLDSSLAARKELAVELGVNAGPHGSAEQNIALHKAVMRKLAENGGKVPESLRN